MATQRQERYEIPEDKRDEVKRLSRESSHATVLRQLAQSRFSKAMDEADSDQKALDCFDAMKSASLVQERAQAALLDFLKGLDASIEAEPQNWALTPDDAYLVYNLPPSGKSFPDLRRANGAN